MKYFLGIEVAHFLHGILLISKITFLDLLAKTDFSGCQPAKTPIEVNHMVCLNVREKQVDIGWY